MIIALWSVKGGSGVTVVSIGIAVRRASEGEQVLLVDLCGDLPAALGLSEPSVGSGDWLGSQAEPAALGRIEVATSEKAVKLLPRGKVGVEPDSRRCEAFVAALAADRRTVVVDLGVIDGRESPRGVHAALLSHAARSILVTRPCYLALRRATRVADAPDGIVLVREPGRALVASDVEHVVGAPVIAQVDVDPAIARMIDSGTLAHRAPRVLTKPLGRVA